MLEIRLNYDILLFTFNKLNDMVFFDWYIIMIKFIPIKGNYGKCGKLLLMILAIIFNLGFFR